MMDLTATAESQRVQELVLRSHPSSQLTYRAAPAHIGPLARTDSVNDSASAGNSPFARLRDHLTAEQHAWLAAGQPLSPAALDDACARMRAELAAIASYIPSTIVREQMARPAPGRVSGAYWDGSVLFADLSGFTALSEQFSSLGKQGAEEVSAIINNLFGALVEEIQRYCGDPPGGGLLKFGGDAITAFFDAAALGERHAALACRAALAMQQRMAAFAATPTRAGTFPLRLRVGVHSGRVFAAEVGDAEHVELVVTGRNINRVALAQEIAEPGEVVISSATRALLDAATTGERQAGFHLLRDLPETAPPPPLSRWGWEHGACDMDELLTLAERIDALRPYLPRGLPRRFLAPTDGGAEAGEFRPVTVLFANFFRFSAVLDLLGQDCDTAARVLNAYYRRAQEIVHRYGGIVNKVDLSTYGDKLMALFGAPVAHEDDAERAVRAAFDLRAALAEANGEIAALLAIAGAARGPSFAGFIQRVGISTGVVFAGQVGSAHRHEYTVMGQHVNLAARLMTAAADGAIILAPATRRAVERHVGVRDLPPARLKGLADPVPVAEALHLFEIAQEERRAVGRPALVGREFELDRLIGAAHAAFGGAGRVVALTGEAGVGKTRLIEDTLQRLVLLSGQREDSLPAFFPYSAECQSYEQSTPYAVIRELLGQFFNLSLADDQAADTATLTRRVQQLAPGMARFAPLLSDLLGLPLDETPLTAALTPEQRHDRAQELVEALLLAEAREQPLMLIVDDLHWADASSLDLLARLARGACHEALLLVLGYRLDPPIPEPWCELDHCDRLLIRELSQEGTGALVRALLRGDPPPELAGLIEKAQGNPFFVEEVVRGLVESGALQQSAAGWQLTRGVDEAAIPDSIEGVITARLDRIEDRSREILQVAAVIGRRFPYPVLSGVVLGHDDLVERLRRLYADDLILPEEIERELAYLFKHALTRDVAYEAILYARRRELHHRVARRIEQLHPDRLDEQLALLARHYLLAEDWESAFEYHVRAGRQAQARYANREAITLYERAVQIAPRLASNRTEEGETSRTGDGEILPLSSSTLDSRMIELQEWLGVVHALIGEYDAALGRYEAALALLRRRPEAPIDDLIRLHHHIARVYEKRAEFETAFEWTERAIALAGTIQSPELVRCLLLGAGLHQRQGRYGQALEWGERALRLAERLGSLRDQADAFMLLGGTYRNLGDNTRALDLTSRCLQLYEQVQDLVRLADAHNNLANTYYDLGRLAEARTHYEAGAELKQAIGDIYGQGLIANNLGTLLHLQGKLDEAIAQYRHSLAIYERIGSLYMTGVLHMNLGAAYLLHGDLRVAEDHLRHSAELFNKVGSEDFLPELERYLAELHMRRGDLMKARLACELSLETAARLEARTEEGATRRSLGQILALGGDLSGAWQELEQSLAILREAASPYEIARTLVAMAMLAPMLDRHAGGQAALDEALPILRDVGAQRDIAEAYAIAGLHEYAIEPAVR